MKNNESQDKVNKVLEALESPSSFSHEELKEIFSDEENLKLARSIFLTKETFARKNIPSPDVNKEWNSFKFRNKMGTFIKMSILCATAACLALILYFNFSVKESSNDLKIFEASQIAQIIRQDTVHGKVVISVPRGMQKDVTLPDGTIVTLNAESKLLYDITKFGKNERNVIFIGEGLYNVAKDTIHPFIVQSNNLNTHVLGTVFNIRNYNTEEPKITLLSGSLKVTSVLNKESMKLKPGEQVVLTETSQLITISTTPAEAVVSWQEGYFYFDNQTLSEILCELGRWYNVDVIFKNKSSMNNQLHFKARRNEELSSVIELLNYISKVPIYVSDSSIIVGK